MGETKPEELARLPGKATSKALDALGRHGFDLSRKAVCSGQSSSPPGSRATKIERVMADPVTIYNCRRHNDRISTSGQPTEPQLADIQGAGRPP